MNEVTAHLTETRLKAAPWLKAPETQRLLALLDGTRGRTRAVGGAVRDALLAHARVAGDVDFATELLPDEVLARAAAAGIAAYPTGIDHGTVTLKLGDRIFEVTTLREDVETDGRRAVVRFGVDWRRDAERRDFTLNALYADMEGKLLDPLGGADDCLRGVVRFIGDPDRRLAEDRLRAFRFFRFSASHGGETFDPGGLAAVARTAGDLNSLAAERVGAEFRRMLALPRIARTFATMAEAGVAPLPPDTLALLAGYEWRARRPGASSRLAVIASRLGIDRVRAAWRLANNEVGAAENILAAARLIAEFRLHEAAYRHPLNLADAAEVAATLAGWTETGSTVVAQRLAAIDVPQFPLSGDDLIAAGLASGPVLGAELARLEQVWILSGFRLVKPELLAQMGRQPEVPQAGFVRAEPEPRGH